MLQYAVDTHMDQLLAALWLQVRGQGGDTHMDLLLARGERARKGVSSATHTSSLQSSEGSLDNEARSFMGTFSPCTLQVTQPPMPVNPFPKLMNLIRCGQKRMTRLLLEQLHTETLSSVTSLPKSDQLTSGYQ